MFWTVVEEFGESFGIRERECTETKGYTSFYCVKLNCATLKVCICVHIQRERESLVCLSSICGHVWSCRSVIFTRNNSAARILGAAAPLLISSYGRFHLIQCITFLLGKCTGREKPLLYIKRHIFWRESVG